MKTIHEPQFRKINHERLVAVIGKNRADVPGWSQNAVTSLWPPWVKIHFII
jgi:hypothetical protein